MREVLIFKLPFYQKGGTISKITKVVDNDDEVKYYKKYEYDPKGIEKEPLQNPKNRFSDIKKEYYRDLKEYILNQSEKFQRNKDIKKPCSKTEVTIIVSIAAMCAVLSYVAFHVVGGMWMLAIAATGLGVSSFLAFDDIRKLNQYNNAQKFLQEYKEKGQELNEYNIERDKTKKRVKMESRSSTIVQERNNGNTITKTRVLEM